MKILHVADFLPDLHRTAGGAEFAARRTIEEQARSGLDIEVATLRADFTRQGAPWQRRYEMRNIDPVAPKLAFTVKQLFRPWDVVAAHGLRQAIRASRPDVVHFHNLHYAGLSVLAQARAHGIPSALTVYDYWLFCPSFMLLRSDGALCTIGHGAHCVDCVGRKRMPALRPVKQALFAARPAQFEAAAQQVDRFVVLSDASRDLLVHHGIDAARVHVIPQHSWREAAADKTQVDPVPGRMLYVGWLEPRKGLHVVLRALALAARDTPELHLEVLGMAADPRYREEMEALVRDNGLGERVVFREKIPREELLSELRRAWLVTIPEQWENMSPVILTEAMTAGACVLASRVGGIRQFVQEGVHGLLAERDQPEAWAQQMRWSMAHPQQVLAMREAARVRALEVFDDAEIARRTHALYTSLLGRAPAA